MDHIASNMKKMNEKKLEEGKKKERRRKEEGKKKERRRKGFLL